MKPGKFNDIQFATVREDPEVELNIFSRFKIQRPILIASGGCTALSIASRFPHMPITLVEPNISQITLIKKKLKVVTQGSGKSIKRNFSVGKANMGPHGLIEAGNFESLFRQFRNFIFEFVLSEDDVLHCFTKPRKKVWVGVFQHPYWTIAFDLFFSDVLLRTMFGDTAIQHAPEGSYSVHFRRVIEQGLLRRDSKTNYFLHHIFLGHYLNKKNALPTYLRIVPKNVKVSFINSMAEDVKSYAPYDFVGLSNIFDWSSEKQIRFLAKRLGHELKHGSVVMFRQLNNSKVFTSYFSDQFVWHRSLSKKLFVKDRSLFYSSLNIGVKK